MRSSSDFPSPAPRKWSQTILACFWFKLVGATTFTLLFFTVYLYLLRHPGSAVHTISLTAVDRWIPFNSNGMPIYVSLWVYLFLPLILMFSRQEITTYGLRAAAPCLIGLAIFFWWPSAIPPVGIDWSLYPSVAFIKQVDTAGNACPSLHVATAVFTACWLHWRLRLHRAPAWLTGSNWLWCAAIAWSTMAIRQHVVIDVVAGALLGLACAWLTGLKQHALHAHRHG
ncbi:phosphatase PAP2 family protein [Leeia oryzae]|uniref:phosphatase PAP2 family protein n=1 Tax=Leeia oryzae TaxID=356662 RepID=UPI00037720BE|nr:phosphatase PAP2 family protein [Leeia oryzae]